MKPVISITTSQPLHMVEYFQRQEEKVCQELECFRKAIDLYQQQYDSLRREKILIEESLIYWQQKLKEEK